MDELAQFCQSASQGVLRGLGQELKIEPDIHYRARGYNSARVTTVKMAGINPTYLNRIIGMTDQLTMWSGLPQRYKVRVSYHGANIFIEIPKPPRFWKQITLDYLQDRHLLKNGQITLGLGLQDNPVRVNFDEPDIAHLLIVGQTRSGKTNTQQLIAQQLCKQGAKLIVIDVAKKNYNWGMFARCRNLLHPLCTEVESVQKVLTWCYKEIDRRTDVSRHSQNSLEDIFIIVDELKALIDESELAKQYLSRIAAIGGEFGLHLILATQYPQINMLGSAELKRNVATRLCGKVDDGTAATNALGIKNSGAASLQGYGDFLLKDSLGLNRLTIARIENRHIAQLPMVETVNPLPIPSQDTVNQGPIELEKQVYCPEPNQVASALFEPAGINKLAKRLKVGNSKATEIRQYADGIQAWAVEAGYKTSECDGFREFYFRSENEYDPRP